MRGGIIHRDGDPTVARELAAALDVHGDDVEARSLTHGFHSYPARLHPLTVRRLLQGVGRGAVVLDPFVGSGTTLVEVALAGAAGQGVDLNPLALELCWLKATVFPPRWRSTVQAAAQAVVERVAREVADSKRRTARATGETRPARWATRFDDPSRYPPHVFRELVALRLAIDALTAEPSVRRALLLVLSSIVVKVSRQRSDTDPTLVERAIARGAATRHFARRAVELGARLDALAAAVPPATPLPVLHLGDARRLGAIADATIDRVITSPPYLGTYDYSEHHVRRLGWLGLDASTLARSEIGARRGGLAPQEALATWERDTAAWIGELARVLKPGARAYVLIGDSRLGTLSIAGHQTVARAALSSGLVVRARAWQARRTAPDGPRSEHLLQLERPISAAAPRTPRR